MMLMFRLADYIRNEIADYMGDEKAHEEWDEVGDESENDIAGLALSFLLVQVARYTITGVLPNAAGIEEHPDRRSFPCVAWLLGLGGIFAMIMMIGVALISWEQKAMTVHGVKPQNMTGLDPWSVYLKRWLRMVPQVANLASMWCLLFSSKWLAQRLTERTAFEPNCATECSCLALATSFCGLGSLFWLDYMADSTLTGPILTMSLRMLMKATGFLIGVSWELAFDAGVESIAETTEDDGWWVPAVAKLGMAFLVALVVIPGYRTHILRQVLDLQKQHEASMLDGEGEAQETSADDRGGGESRGLMAKSRAG
jgi:hypothetical protein